MQYFELQPACNDIGNNRNVGPSIPTPFVVGAFEGIYKITTCKAPPERLEGDRQNVMTDSGRQQTEPTAGQVSTQMELRCCKGARQRYANDNGGGQKGPQITTINHTDGCAGCVLEGEDRWVLRTEGVLTPKMLKAWC